MDRTTFQSKYGPWALVTGASSGIGRAFAERLAELRLKLVLAARREPLLGQIAQHLMNRYGTETKVIACDFCTPEAVETIQAGTHDLDIGLFIGAAGFGTSGPFLDNEISDEVEMIKVNCATIAQLSHVFGRRLVARGGGGMVLMSSLVAFQGVPRAANYAATKAYVQSLAEALHVELKSKGVDVLASAPGPVASGFANRAGMTMGQAQTPEEVARGTLAAIGRRATVRPGLLAKFLEASLAPMPRRVRVKIMARVMAGMTGA